MVGLRVDKTCAIRLTLVDCRCCYYYCASVCLIIMSNISTVEKKSETKSNPQYSPTIRIKVELFEPTESRCPVFNYQKLLIEEKKRRRRDHQSNSFEENDESIKLAEHFEQKYGFSGVKKKKKKKTTFYNYSELAAGYDENDSFIDNTEIFDEVMPEEVETEHGGYYVNTGVLNFKEVYLSEDSEEIKSSQPRKHFINSVLEDSDEKLPSFAVSNNSEKNSLKELKTSETSNDSSSCSDEEKETLKPCSSMNGSTKRKQSVDSDSASSIIPIKKKKINTVVKSSIQEKKIHIPDCKPSCSKNNQLISSEEIPSTEQNVSSISDTIESVIYASCPKSSNASLKSENDVVKTEQIVTNTPNNIDLPVSNGVHNAVELPEIVVDIIESIKTEAQVAIKNDLNVFSEQINLYILSLEYQKELVEFNSESIYSTLAEYMSCNKEELVKHVNQLVDSEEAKIIEPVKKLKSAIEKILPSVIEQYNLECNKIIDQRTVNGISIDGLKSKPGPKRPRRKFPWNEEFRAYIRDIIHIRTTLYSKIKRSSPIDIFIEHFINSQIKPLWPPGWMKSTIILRELKVKEKDSRPKLPKKQPLQNSPMKLLSAIKIASEHKVSNSAMNKVLKWNKQKPSKRPDTSITGTASVSTSHISSPTSTTTPIFKQVYNSHSVAISTLSNDTCPYQATITTTAINGCKQKESDKNSVIKSKISAEDILDLSPNKANLVSFAIKKPKDVSVICNTLPENNSSTKSDLYVSSKNIHQPISRKQRLLQLHNTPLSEQQKLSMNSSSNDQQSSKPKDDKVISQSNKLDCIKVDDKSTAKDMLSQIINESLMDNTSPLPSQFTSNNLYKPREETKSPASISTQSDTKNEFVDWQHTSRTPSSQRPSSADLVEIEAQEVIRDLLILNQMSSSINKKDNMFKKHSSSVSMYSSPSTDSLTNVPLGVIHHPAYRNSYNTTSSTKSRNEPTHETTIGIPKMSIGLQDEFLKHMVKTEEPSSRLTTDNYQKHGIPHYGIIQTNAQLSGNSYQQKLYSTLNKQPNQDMSHNSITYKRNTND